jgi:hypothetical protein
MAAALQYAVDDDPIVLVYASAGCRRRVAVRTKTGDGVVYVSSSATVTTATGFPVLATDPPLILDVGETESLYAVTAAAATATVCVMAL